MSTVFKQSLRLQNLDARSSFKTSVSNKSKDYEEDSLKSPAKSGKLKVLKLRKESTRFN